jgi:hypothetical protein
MKEESRWFVSDGTEGSGEWIMPRGRGRRDSLNKPTEGYETERFDSGRRVFVGNCKRTYLYGMLSETTDAGAGVHYPFGSF